MTNNINNMLMASFYIIIVMAIVMFVTYIVVGIYLNKLNVILYGKKTPMAWIPFVNIYLLGKLTLNKIVGWILIICMFLQSETTTTVNGVSKTTSFLPENIRSVFSRVFSLVCLLLIIYAIIKYYKLRNQNQEVRNKFDNSNNNITNNITNEKQDITNNINTEISNNNVEKTTINNVSFNSNVDTEEQNIDPTTWEFVQDEVIFKSDNDNSSNDMKEVEIIDDINSK